MNSPLLRISEIFDSSQGEGQLAGTPSVFIRLSGCNLRCWFCDTPYASWAPEGDWVSLQEVLRIVRATERRHVVITGGEPFLQPALVELTQALSERQIHITLETAGTVFRNVACDLMSISPKLQSSGPRPGSLPDHWPNLHETRRWNASAIEQLIALAPAWQLKYVVEDRADCDELLRSLAMLESSLKDLRQHVWVMPQARSVLELDERASWLRPWCRQEGLNYCDRWQLRWYGNRPGT